MYNFIVFSLSRWNVEFGCNIKDICWELSKHHKVLFIDVPLKRKDRWFNKTNPAVVEVRSRLRDSDYLAKVANNLWHYIDDSVLESVNSIKSDYIFDFVNRINGRRFSKVIKKAAKQVGFSDFILLNDNDIYNGFYLNEYINPKLIIYYLRDRLPAMNYWKRHTSRLESVLIRKAGLILTNSQYLNDYATDFNRNSIYVGQGCDVSHFLNSPPQSEVDQAVAKIPKPIVGYIGALNSERLDIELIIKLAERMTNFSFVFVGQEDSAFSSSRLHELKNVFFLGKKEFKDLPRYLYGFDIAFNPQLINEITIGNYPRKVDEYLAAGKPVVGTKTHAMEPFKEHTYLAETVQQFEDCIKKALDENSPTKIEARKVFASHHTWEQSAHSMIEAINNHFGHEKSNG